MDTAELAVIEQALPRIPRSQGRRALAREAAERAEFARLLDLFTGALGHVQH